MEANTGNWRAYIYNANEWKAVRHRYFLEAMDAGFAGQDCVDYANSMMERCIWAHTGRQQKPAPMAY